MRWRVVLSPLLTNCRGMSYRLLSCEEVKASALYLAARATHDYWHIPDPLVKQNRVFGSVCIGRSLESLDLWRLSSVKCGPQNLQSHNRPVNIECDRFRPNLKSHLSHCNRWTCAWSREGSIPDLHIFVIFGRKSSHFRHRIFNVSSLLYALRMV